jgi:hypothetical protein
LQKNFIFKNVLHILEGPQVASVLKDYTSLCGNTSPQQVAAINQRMCGFVRPMHILEKEKSDNFGTVFKYTFISGEHKV